MMKRYTKANSSKKIIRHITLSVFFFGEYI